MPEKTTVSVLGACVSRDIFDLIQPDHYDVKRCVTMVSPLAMVMKKPEESITLTSEDLANIDSCSNYEKRLIFQDFNKTFFDYFAEVKTEWFMLDIADVRLDITAFEHNPVKISAGPPFKKVKDKLCSLFGNPEIIKPNDFSFDDIEKYINLYLDEILKIYNPEQIIFHEYYCVKDYITKSKTIMSRMQEYVERSNKYIKFAAEIVKKRIPSCHIIRMPENVISNEIHKWGLAVLHFDMLYYEYGKKAFDVIAARKSREEENAELDFLNKMYSELFFDLRKKYSNNITNSSKTTASQIIFSGIGKAEYVSLTPKAIKAADVEIQIVYSLISNGAEKDILSAVPNTPSVFPTNAGYSAVGTVTTVGTSIKSIKPGDRVFVECGGHSDVIVQDIHKVTLIPDSVTFEEAVFAKIASCSLAAIRRARLEIGESVVIVGLGMLGLFGVQFARIGGGLPIIAVGNRDCRREKAKQFGADYVFAPDEPDLTKKIYGITDKRTIIHGANIVIETSGSENGLLKCLEYTAKNARVALTGCNRAMTQPVDFYKYVHTRGVNIIGVHGQTRPQFNSYPGNWTAKRDIATVLQLIADNRLDSKSIISEFVSPKDAASVYDRLFHDKEFPIGVIFDWTHL